MKHVFLLMSLLLTFQYSESQSLKRSKTTKNDSVFLELINPFIVPIEIKLTPLDSTQSFIKVNPYGLLKQGDTLKRALVIPLNKVTDTSVIDFKNYLKFSAKFGNPHGDYDKDYEYDFPFQNRKKYKIIQSFGGKFSHNKAHSKYAVDIGLAIGDTITAARKGKVYFVKEDSKEHCRTRKCVNMANKIYIVHEDGTMAHYVHLDFEGALVDVGDTVQANQPIGISGMTGFTTTPHLHFVLYKSGSISIPFRFKGVRHTKLKQGKYYTKKVN